MDHLFNSLGNQSWLKVAFIGSTEHKKWMQAPEKRISFHAKGYRRARLNLVKQSGRMDITARLDENARIQMANLQIMTRCFDDHSTKFVGVTWKPNGTLHLNSLCYPQGKYLFYQDDYSRHLRLVEQTVGRIKPRTILCTK